MPKLTVAAHIGTLGSARIGYFISGTPEIFLSATSVHVPRALDGILAHDAWVFDRKLDASWGDAASVAQSHILFQLTT